MMVVFVGYVWVVLELVLVGMVGSLVVLVELVLVLDVVRVVLGVGWVLGWVLGVLGGLVCVGMGVLVLEVELVGVLVVELVGKRVLLGEQLDRRLLQTKELYVIQNHLGALPQMFQYNILQYVVLLIERESLFFHH